MPKSRGRNGRRMKTRQRQMTNRRHRVEGRKAEPDQIVVSRDMIHAYRTDAHGAVRHLTPEEAAPYIQYAKRQKAQEAQRSLRDYVITQAMMEAMQPLPPKPPSGLVDSQGQPVEGISKPGVVLGPDGRPL